MDFEKVLKKLLISSFFLMFFTNIHINVSKEALSFSSSLIKDHAPNHFILKKWYQTKIRSEKRTNNGFLDLLKIKVSDITIFDDLIAHAMFVLSHIFLFFLKLIYSTVFHLTYILAPIGALLFLFDITEGSLRGFITSSIWCTFMPLVLVCILLIVGDTFNSKDSTISHIDSLIWLFGITFLLVLTPVITLGIISSSGISSYSSLFGSKMLSQSLASYALIKTMSHKGHHLGRRAIFKGKQLREKIGNNII